MIKAEKGKVNIKCADNIEAMSDFITVVVGLVTNGAIDWGDIIFSLGQAQEILKRVETGDVEITEEENA